MSGSYVYPVSENQRQLWLQLETSGVGSAYIVSALVRVHAAPDVDALRAALAWLVARHDALRTGVEEHDGALVQVVHDELEPAALAAAVEWMPASSSTADLERAADRPMDVAAAPLIAVTGLSTSADEHLLAIRLHHIVSDGWSLGIVVDELLGAYAAFASGTIPQADEVPLQYPDFTLWLEESATPELAEERMRFWREALDGVPPELDVPRSRPRPPVPDNRSSGLRRRVDGALLARVDAVAAAAGATVQQVLLAAFEVVLARYAGQELFALGTVSARRDELGFAGTVGFLANLIPVRADLRGDPTFEQVVARVRAHAAAATQYQDAGLPELLTGLDVPRAAGVPPLVQVGMQLLYESEPDPSTTSAEMPWSRVPPPEEFAVESPLDIVLTAVRSAGLQLRLEYVTALYDEQFMADLVDNYLILLDSATAAPQTVVWRLDLLNPAERQRVLAWAGPVAAVGGVSAAGGADLRDWTT